MGKSIQRKRGQEMSKEEAIKYLNEFILFKKISNTTEEEAIECFKLAIKALQQQPSEDCISRDATLTAFSDYVGGGMSMNDFDAMWDIVVKMPPVEPKPKTSEDCISRKAAIDALKQQAENMLCWSERYAEQRKGILTAINIVSDLLSVTPQSKEEPQLKTGRWIEHKHGGIEHIECSECGVWFLKANLIRKSYCPNCGSCNGDMIKNIMKDIANNNGGAK